VQQCCAMTRQQRSGKAWAKWRKLVAEQARSGETVAAFCRSRRLCAPYFFAWKKRLSRSTGAKFVEVKLAEAAPEPRVPGDSRVEVRLPNGRSRLVGPGFDAEHLRALLAVVESRA
jgi:hypothetical protein